MHHEIVIADGRSYKAFEASKKRTVFLLSFQKD